MGGGGSEGRRGSNTIQLVEKPTTKERRSKTKHDPAPRTRVETPASEPAQNRTEAARTAKTAELASSTFVDLDVIPDAPDAGVDGAPEITMEVSEAADPPPATETVSAEASKEPATSTPPGDGTIVVVGRRSSASGAGLISGSRPMKTWRVANAERAALPPGAALSGIPVLVAEFSRSREKVAQAALVAKCDLERLEGRTAVSLQTRVFQLIWFGVFSLFLSQWGRASAPIGCSPRESGRLRVSRAESRYRLAC